MPAGQKNTSSSTARRRRWFRSQTLWFKGFDTSKMTTGAAVEIRTLIGMMHASGTKKYELVDGSSKTVVPISNALVQGVRHLEDDHWGCGRDSDANRNDACQRDKKIRARRRLVEDGGSDLKRSGSRGSTPRR